MIPKDRSLVIHCNNHNKLAVTDFHLHARRRNTYLVTNTVIIGESNHIKKMNAFRKCRLHHTVQRFASHAQNCGNFGDLMLLSA